MQKSFDRPDALHGETRKVKMGCGNIYITVNKKFGEPIEIFCRVGKSGACQGALLQGVSRLVSVALQDKTQRERIIKTLKGIRCMEAQPGEPGQNPTSCLDALAGILNMDFQDGQD